jgi:hypothetical protein
MGIDPVYTNDVSRALSCAQKEFGDLEAPPAQKDHYGKLIESLQAPKTGPKFLIFQPCSTGDIIVSSLSAELFKIKYPGCTVSYLTETPEAIYLLRSNPFIDYVIYNRKWEIFNDLKKHHDKSYRLYWWNPPMVKSFLEDLELPTDYTRVRVHPSPNDFMRPTLFWGDTARPRIILQDHIAGKWSGDRNKLRGELEKYGQVRDVSPLLGYSFPEVGALFSLADLVVCVEGSISHLAAAVGCQTVTLSSIYNPEYVMVEYYQNQYLPEYKKHITVRPKKWCNDFNQCITRDPAKAGAGAGNPTGFPNKVPPLVYKKCGSFPKSCIANIPVEDIMESVEIAFQRRKK